MLKKWKKIGMIGLVWMFVFETAICGSWCKSTSAQAASQKNKALKAYRKFLEKQSKVYGNANPNKIFKKSCKFCVKDINKDGIPELFIFLGWTGNMEYVYSYDGKKVKNILYVGHGTINWVNPQKGVISYADHSSSKDNRINDFGAIDGYIKVSSKAKYSVEAEKIENGFGDYHYYVNGKDVKKSAYDKKVKKFKTKKAKLKYRSYTAANVSKYLK